MNKEFIEKIESQVKNINILDKDPFVEESCKNVYRALLVVAENENIPISEIENISDRNIENAVSFTLNMADGKEVQCKVEETEDIYTAFLTNAIMEAVEETGGALEKSQKVNAILKVLSDVIGG